MNQRVGEPADGCSTGCAHCRLPEVLAEGTARQGQLQGWAMVGVSAGAFLIPLALAIGGAVLAPLAWAHSVSQLLGGIVGLILGMTGSAVLITCLRGGGHRQK